MHTCKFLLSERDFIVLKRRDGKMAEFNSISHLAKWHGVDGALSVLRWRVGRVEKGLARMGE